MGGGINFEFDVHFSVERIDGGIQDCVVGVSIGVELPEPAEMYKALLERDSAYEGVFVFAVRTTGVFCRTTCPARRPLPRNVEYFPSSREALLAGYRPCKRCRPLQRAGENPAWLASVLEALERDPSRRWRDRDLRDLGLAPERVRRWFRLHHGMTFHAYARARRLGSALAQIRQGDELLDAAFASGFDSDSGFRDAFAKMFGTSPGRASRADLQEVRVTRVLTPLGAMVAGATRDALCLLEFGDRPMLATQISRLRDRLPAYFVPGPSPIVGRLQGQLDRYFAGTLREFDLPLSYPGTEFQRLVWDGLRTIPYGEARSYRRQAELIGRPKALRAVGKANGDNRIAIVVPCHRVIGANGELVGYGGELWRKKALLSLEGAAWSGNRSSKRVPSASDSKRI